MGGKAEEIGDWLYNGRMDVAYTSLKFGAASTPLKYLTN